jgi:hypothetical protein
VEAPVPVDNGRGAVDGDVLCGGGLGVHQRARPAAAEICARAISADDVTS